MATIANNWLNIPGPQGAFAGLTIPSCSVGRLEISKAQTVSGGPYFGYSCWFKLSGGAAPYFVVRDDAGNNITVSINGDSSPSEAAMNNLCNCVLAGLIQVNLNQTSSTVGATGAFHVVDSVGAVSPSSTFTVVP